MSRDYQFLILHWRVRAETEQGRHTSALISRSHCILLFPLILAFVFILLLEIGSLISACFIWLTTLKSIRTRIVSHRECHKVGASNLRFHSDRDLLMFGVHQPRVYQAIRKEWWQDHPKHLHWLLLTRAKHLHLAQQCLQIRRRVCQEWSPQR